MNNFFFIYYYYKFLLHSQIIHSLSYLYTIFQQVITHNTLLFSSINHLIVFNDQNLHQLTIKSTSPILYSAPYLILLNHIYLIYFDTSKNTIN